MNNTPEQVKAKLQADRVVCDRQWAGERPTSLATALRDKYGVDPVYARTLFRMGWQAARGIRDFTGDGVHAPAHRSVADVARDGFEHETWSIEGGCAH